MLRALDDLVQEGVLPVTQVENVQGFLIFGEQEVHGLVVDILGSERQDFRNTAEEAKGGMQFDSGPLLLAPGAMSRKSLDQTIGHSQSAAIDQTQILDEFQIQNWSIQPGQSRIDAQ